MDQNGRRLVDSFRYVSNKPKGQFTLSFLVTCVTKHNILLCKYMKTPLDKIKEAVLVSAKYPNAMIEYNFEVFPDLPGIKPDSFFGIQAKFNKNVSLEKAVNVIYKLS